MGAAISDHIWTSEEAPHSSTRLQRVTQPPSSSSVFDRVADLYDAVRPAYPEALYDDLLSLTATAPSGRVLEVGAGTGQATAQLASRGLTVVALEPGERLAERARSRVARLENVSVITTTFEDWPSEPAAFDLVLSATAFHWVDSHIGYAKAAECLKPGGWIGLFWNRHVSGPAKARFMIEVQEAYQRWAPDLVKNLRLASLEDATGDERIADSGLFGPTTIRRYGWQESHSARRYSDLLRTYSDHMALRDESREGLLADIERIIEKSFGGTVVLDRATVLYVAQVADSPN